MTVSGDWPGSKGSQTECPPFNLAGRGCARREGETFRTKCLEILTGGERCQATEFAPHECQADKVAVQWRVLPSVHCEHEPDERANHSCPREGR